jgi:hypothetical protein
MANKPWGICDKRCDLYKICEETGKSGKCAFVTDKLPIIKRHDLGLIFCGNKTISRRVKAARIETVSDLKVFLSELDDSLPVMSPFGDSDTTAAIYKKNKKLYFTFD